MIRLPILPSELLAPASAMLFGANKPSMVPRLRLRSAGSITWMPRSRAAASMAGRFSHTVASSSSFPIPSGSRYLTCFGAQSSTSGSKFSLGRTEISRSTEVVKAAGLGTVARPQISDLLGSMGTIRPGKSVMSRSTMESRTVLPVPAMAIHSGRCEWSMVCGLSIRGPAV